MRSKVSVSIFMSSKFFTAIAMKIIIFRQKCIRPETPEDNACKSNHSLYQDIKQ